MPPVTRAHSYLGVLRLVRARWYGSIRYHDTEGCCLLGQGATTRVGN